MGVYLIHVCDRLNLKLERDWIKMADKARPCPCTDPELPQFKWVSTEDPIAGRALKALHTDKGFLTGEECSECASKGPHWYKLAAIVIATKTTDDVHRALDVVRQQSPRGDYHLEEFARLLRVLSTLYQEKMVTEQEVEELRQAVWPWDCLVQIQCTKPPDVVKRTAELLAEVKRDVEGKQLNVLSTLYQEKMVTDQEMEELKPLVRPWNRLVQIQCTKPPDVVKKTAELLPEVKRDELGKQLKVLSTLYQETMVTEQEVEELKQAEKPWDCLVRIQCIKPPDVVKRTAELLAEVGCVQEGKQLKVLSTLYQEKMVTDQEIEELKQSEMLSVRIVQIQCTKRPDVVKRTAELLPEVGRDEEVIKLKVLSTLYQEKMVTDQEMKELKALVWPWRRLVQIQCTKPPDVVKRTAELLPEMGGHEEGKQLKVLSTLYQEKMVTEQEVEELKQAVRPFDRLVQIQCTKPPDVVKRTAKLLPEMGGHEEGKQLKVLSTLYQEKMVTDQEMEELKPLVRPWNGLVQIQCTKPPDVVKKTAELLAEVGHDGKGKRVKVLSALYQKKVIAQHDVQKWIEDAQYMLHSLIFDQCTRPSEDVATAADVLDMVECEKEAEMLRVLSVLRREETLKPQELDYVCFMRKRVCGQSAVMKVSGVGRELWQTLVDVQCRKPPEVVTTTTEVLDELGLKEKATQLRVLSELYQKKLITEQDVNRLLRHHNMRHSSRHWLDSLVDYQSSKSADVHAGTFDTLRRLSLTEVVKERQTKHTDVTKYQLLPSTVETLQEWGRLSEHLLSKESQLVSSMKELHVSPPKTKVSSQQPGSRSDPSEREDTSNLLTDEAALKRLCWIPFDIKTVSIEAEGGILCLESTSDDMQVAKEDTIFVEVPPDAVSTSANVKMRYAIIPSGPFTLPKGYQFGSPVVYIYYDGRRVTKPLALHLPHWYGGEDHARDGLSFAVAPHSLKGRSVYHFQLLAGKKFPSSSRYGVVEIHGHCSLYAEVFMLKAPSMYLATFLVKEKSGKTKCNVAVTHDSTNWAQIMKQRCKRGWKVLKHDPFQFKQDRITATFNDSCHVCGDWRADFTGTSEILASDVQYDSRGIDSHKLLEKAVKNYSYPPTINTVVEYRKELKSKGRPTVVKLHISGMDRKMEFPCTAYEQIQVAPPPHTPGPARDQDGTTIQPRFAILTANANEKRAVMHYLQLGKDHDRLSGAQFPRALGCCYKADAFLKEASVVGNDPTLDYSTFTIEVSGKKIAGVHVHCDSYGPWGAFEKTVQLLTNAKSKKWPLKTIFVVGCCGASMSEQRKEKEAKEGKAWCGTVLLANEVNSYLHTGKAEAGTDAIKGNPKHREIETKWLDPLESVTDPMVDTGFRVIKVQRALYLSGPLVIKNQLFGDNCRGGQDIVGVEMEVIGVIQAVDAIHDYLGSSKDNRPGIVLAKGISDCTEGKEKKAKCVFFGVTEEIDDDSRQVYATLQSIALVIRCVAKHIQEFYEPSHTM